MLERLTPTREAPSGRVASAPLPPGVKRCYGILPPRIDVRGVLMTHWAKERPNRAPAPPRHPWRPPPAVPPRANGLASAPSSLRPVFCGGGGGLRHPCLRPVAPRRPCLPRASSARSAASGAVLLGTLLRCRHAREAPPPRASAPSGPPARGKPPLRPVGRRLRRHPGSAIAAALPPWAACFAACSAAPPAVLAGGVAFARYVRVAGCGDARFGSVQTPALRGYSPCRLPCRREEGHRSV